MVKIDYTSKSINNEGKIRFGKFELNIYEDLKSCGAHIIDTKKMPIEVDATTSRYIDDIIKKLNYPESSSIV